MFRIISQYKIDDSRYGKENKEKALELGLAEARRICRDFEDNKNFPLTINVSQDAKRGAWIITVEMEFKHYKCFRRQQNGQENA